MPLDDDLGAGRHFERHRLAIDKFDLPAAQKPRELIFRKRVGNGRNGGKDGAGVGADDASDGERPALFLLPARVMLRAAAMREPAHDRFVLAKQLHPVDAEIEVVFASCPRPPRDDEGPGDERCGLTRPAGLDRQRREVDVASLQHNLLAGRAGNRLRLHRHHRLEERQHADRLAKPARRLRLAQEGQRLADFAQIPGPCPFDTVPTFRRHRDPARNTLHRAEKIDQNRHGGGPAIRHPRRLENNGWALFGKEPGLDFRHLQIGGNGFFHPCEIAAGIELVEKFAEGGIGHWLLSRAFRLSLEGLRERMPQRGPSPQAPNRCK